jgi:hypothetical protein
MVSMVAMLGLVLNNRTFLLTPIKWSAVRHVGAMAPTSSRGGFFLHLAHRKLHIVVAAGYSGVILLVQIVG